MGHGLGIRFVGRSPWQEMLVVGPDRRQSVAMKPFVFLAICVAGWMDRHQQEVIEYLQEEIRVLKELLGQKPRFNDDQRQRLSCVIRDQTGDAGGSSCRNRPRAVGILDGASGA